MVCFRRSGAPQLLLLIFIITIIIIIIIIIIMIIIIKIIKDIEITKNASKIVNDSKI